MVDNDVDWRIRCSECANCFPYLMPPEEAGCFCEELGVEIGVHETVGACSYFEPREADVVGDHS